MNPDAEIDEERFAASKRMVKVTALRGTPLEGDSCGNCYYYLEPGEPLAFCWNDKLQALVARDWWCQFWEMVAD